MLQKGISGRINQWRDTAPAGIMQEWIRDSMATTVLYDGHAKRVRAGPEVPNAVTDRGDLGEPDHMAGAVGVTWGR